MQGPNNSSGKINTGGSFGIVISRATLKLPEFLRLGAEFAAQGEILIAMKGPGVGVELRAAEATLRTEGLCSPVGGPWTSHRGKEKTANISENYRIICHHKITL